MARKPQKQLINAANATIERCHPAIEMLRTAHADFARELGTVGPCYASDLAHDERALNAHPGQSFAWIMSYHGTHLYRLGTNEECYADLCGRDRGKPWIDMVSECYSPDSPIRFYFWRNDRVESVAGSGGIRSIVRVHSAVDLGLSIRDERCRLALDVLNAKATLLGNEIRYAKSSLGGIEWIRRLERDFDAIDSERHRVHDMMMEVPS